MITTNLRRSIVVLLGILSLPAFGEGDAEAVQKRLAERFPDVRVEQIRPSPIPGLFELRIGPQIAYVSADGRYIVRGDLIEVSTDTNVTEAQRNSARLAAIDDVGEDRMIIFSPAKVKHTISVFTDIDCGYCRRLHREIDQYLAQGIRVRYLFFPRSGPNTESWAKAEAVWCSPDRNAALTKAKLGEVIKVPGCKSTPVQEHYSLGLALGVQGTPAIVTDTGELVPGYVPSDELAQYLRGEQTTG
ncbi:MAG: DsbC family protein [Gammaproteobacteria bacterium]|nr:MAG: DsbC family protein [Gammaproteobacteria bacterium]